MSFIARLQRARELLEQQGRLSARALERELQIGGDELEELIEELVDVQQVARREGRILVWAAASRAARDAGQSAVGGPQPCAPRTADGLTASSSTRPDDAEARKVVTIVFADLVGSTALHERLDAESARRVMDRYYRALRAAVDAHGGTVVKLLGDGVMAAFGVPRVGEDDAMRAVRAAMAMVQAVRGLGVIGLGDRTPSLTPNPLTPDPLSVRVAVNTGEVVVRADNSDVVGDPVNVAARLQQEARDSEVLIGESTRRLVGELVTLAPAGVFALKGRSETVAAYRVVSLERPAGAAASAFVGRDDELRRITAVYDAAVAERRARLAVVLGSPGLGKSRLLDELGRRVGDAAKVVSARCDATGGATFAPIARGLRACLRCDDGSGDEMLRAAIDAALPGDDADSARIAGGIAALLAGTPAPPEETFFVVRRFLAALAATQPVVFAIDDLQWAEPLLLDLVEHLVQWGTGIPLLVLAAARPDLRDLRSSLARTGGLVSDVVTLAGLDAAAATRLAANVIGADALPAAVAGRVLATSEGNPLFVGELVRMLVDDGALKKEGDRWTTAVELATLEMPPTIHALLAARIERLGAEDRTVLERAAVVGRQFSRAAVDHLLPAELRAHLDARLEALRRTELIEPDIGWFLGEPALRFHHALTRDAAYRRVLKGTRAELHARCADWIESRAGEAIEQQETIGWHLEQAHRHLRELGPIDAQGRALGERASRYLAAAGRRALARDDLSVAANLLGRGLHLLDAADPARADLALDWCEALLAAGDVTHARAAMDELARVVSGLTTNNLTTNNLSARLSAWHTCFAGRLAVLTDPQTLHATADAVAAAADELAAVGDAAGEANAHLVHALALSRLGRVGACEAALDKALAAARRGHDRRRANTVLANAPLAALWGPSPVTRASGRCLDVVRVLRITQGAPAVESVALRCQAVLEALRGRTEAARRMIESSRRMVEELGSTQGLLETEMFAGLVALIEGDTAAAEHSLRAAYEGLRQHGLGIDAARAAALLGRTLLAQGRAAEAEALSHESEALAGDDLQAAITWRRVRAEALARRGEHAAAVAFARAAVDIAAATDALLHHADARLALAVALRAGGRQGEAAAEEARAIELWEAKGATVLAEHAPQKTGRTAPIVPESVTRTEPTRGVRRRIRTNAASVVMARLEAAFAARDLTAIDALVGDFMETVDHPTGSTYGREAQLDSAKRMLRMPDLSVRAEPLATLGESLCLSRRVVAARGTAGGHFDVAEYEMEHIAICKLDEVGRCGHFELFAPNHLGAAIGRFYERYAELLREGPARARAAATARSVAALLGPLELGRFATALAPTVEFVDQRPLGLPSSRGREAFLGGLRSLLEASAESATRVEDVLGLRADALLARLTNFGTERSGGGAYERPLLALWAFGTDGLVARVEFFHPDHDTEALARFDELSAEPAPAQSAATPSRTSEKSVRRVRPNAATANVARIEAAIAGRDADALPSLFSEIVEFVEHPTGAVYDREGVLQSLRPLLGARDPAYRPEPLATLGEALALYRVTVSATALAGGAFDVGAYEIERIDVVEVDKQGRGRRCEDFSIDRLGDAIVRLYERYAELLPDGPARSRAAAIARSVALSRRQVDLDHFAEAFAPAVEVVDHRTLGTWSSRGAEELLRHWRSLFDLADVAQRDDDILALQPDAFLVSRIFFGSDRASRGVYEAAALVLFAFGANGLLTRIEAFDPDRAVEALARFDELTNEARAGFPRAAQIENAATCAAERLDEAMRALDIDGYAALLAPGFRNVDRRRVVGTDLDRDQFLDSFRWVFARLSRMDPASEVLATRGDRLALLRTRVDFTEPGSGPSEIEFLQIFEVDALGRYAAGFGFDPDDLDAAYAELDDRYTAGEGASFAARRFDAFINGRDWDGLAERLAPELVVQDNRRLGWEPLRGPAAYLASLKALVDLAPDARIRLNDIRESDRAALFVTTLSGTREGGAFEDWRVNVAEFDGRHRLCRLDFHDLDQLDAGLTRYEELLNSSVSPLGTGRIEGPPRPVRRRVRPNAATVVAARLDAAIATRDAQALPDLFADEGGAVDHITHTAWDRQAVLSSWHSFLLAEDPECHHEPLATLGDSLALCRVSLGAGGLARGSFDGGAYEKTEIHLIEADAQGRRRWTEVFDADRLGDAVARLYERHAELLPAGPERERAAATARSVARWLLGPHDPDSYAGTLAADLESVDHRIVGTWSAHGAEAVLRHMRALFDLIDDYVARHDDILALRSDAFIVRRTTSGTDRAGGGAWERPYLGLLVFGADGLFTRWEQFEVDREDEALARFDELGDPSVSPLGKERIEEASSPSPSIENAARKLPA